MQFIVKTAVAMVALIGLALPESAVSAEPVDNATAGKVDTMAESRVRLEGDVLQIGFFGTGKAPYPEDIVSPAVLRALAQYMKVDLKTQGVFWGDYCYFAGASGEAFRFLEFMNLSPDNANRPLVERYGHISRMEMYRQALQSAGLESQTYAKPASADKAALRQQIVQSLRDRKTPVIGLGVFGPPEAFLITGYDEGGDVLLGWSHFQAEKKGDPNLSQEPTGEFRLRNWADVIDGVVIVTGRKQETALRQVYRDAIGHGLTELRTAGDGLAVGTAVMEKWAQHLEKDADFAGLSDAQWRKALSDHQTTAGDLAERRALAASFLGLASGVLPEAADDLKLAQAACQGSHDTVYEIWETVANTGPFDADLAKFKDPSRRRTLAQLVRRLIQLDQHAAAHLERAAKIVDGKDPGPAIAPDALLDGTAVLKKAVASATTKPAWAPENISLPNTLGMLRVFLGEPFGELNDAEKQNQKLDYVLWMGFSGAAFGMLDDGPERSNLPLAFDALGYDYELWLSPQLAGETGLPCKVWGWDDNLRRRIFWNLRDRRLPVVLFNCGKWPDWWLVTQAHNWGDFEGYGGSDGQGYRPNEPLDDPKNPLRKIDLFDGMKGKQTWTINLLARRTSPKPSMDELYRRAIQWGAAKMQRPDMRLLNDLGDEFVSTQPYQDWAAMMRTDALFPADDPETLKKRREFLVGREVELAERRFYVASFLDLAASRLKRPELKEAADHFRAVNKLMEQIWAQLGGMESPQGHLKYADSDVRGRIADLLLQIEREDTAAGKLLSK